MQIKNKILVIVTATVTLITGCKKELDQQPIDFFGESNAYLTLADVQLGVNGAYGRYSAYGDEMYANALLSDEAKLGADNAGQGALTYRLQFGSDATSGGDVTAAYYSHYSLIDQVNRVLPFISTVTAEPSQEPRRNILRGQLLALRAISHFSLLEGYADRYDPAKPGVALMLASSVVGKPARNTIGEVMTRIEQDLSEAKVLLQGTAATFTDTVMNEVNIAAYQARISLYKGDYQQAINYATEVINFNLRPLVTSSNFNKIWTDSSNGEVLFRRRYSTGTNIGSLWTTTGNLVYIAPSDKLIASYSANDIRKNTFIGQNSSGNNYVKKFFTSSKGGRVVDIKAIRIAEMYLIRAESYAKLGNITLGAADLNTLRSLRIANYITETFADGSALLSAVLDERFKELAFEGFRFYDLKRNNLPLMRNASDANSDWQSLLANSFRWLLPLPSEEIIVNPNAKQNPGY